MYSNTSYVAINQLQIRTSCSGFFIQIHRMLLLIGVTQIVILLTKYIQIHRMLLLIPQLGLMPL